VIKRLLAVVLVVACAAGAVSYQVMHPSRAPASPRVFVPSPHFFTDFSPSFRTSIADAYYLFMVQYYGEHVNGDHRLDSLPAMVNLITTLSPHYTKAYIFGAFALMDAGHADLGYKLLQRGFKENPGDWHFPDYLGFFAYTFGKGAAKDKVVGDWYRKAAALPGSPPFVKQLAAAMLGKGGETEKAVLLWGQVYSAGDKYSQQKAVAGLDKILPADKAARMKALAPLYNTMPKDDFETLVAELFKGYQ
jgi:hypothetical protein